MAHSFFFKSDNERIVDFYGFRWTPLALHANKEFCDDIQRSIRFETSECILWVGKTYKFWLDDNHFVLVPKSKYAQGFQGILHKCILYTRGRLPKIDKSRWLVQKCGNPLCINPHHSVAMKRNVCMTQYLDKVQYGIKPDNYMSVFTAHFINENRWLCRPTKEELAENIGSNPPMIEAYATTGRLLWGKIAIYKETFSLDKHSPDYWKQTGDEYA